MYCNYHNLVAALASQLNVSYTLHVTAHIADKRISAQKFPAGTTIQPTQLNELLDSISTAVKKDRIITFVVTYNPLETIATLTYTIPRYKETGYWTELPATKSRDAFSKLNVTDCLFTTATVFFPNLKELIQAQ